MRKTVFNLSIGRTNGSYEMTIKVDPAIEALMSQNGTIGASSSTKLLYAGEFLAAAVAARRRVAQVNPDGTPTLAAAGAAVLAPVSAEAISVKFHSSVPALTEISNTMGFAASLPERLVDASSGRINIWPLRLKGSSLPGGVTVTLPTGQYYSEEELVDYMTKMKAAVKMIYARFIKPIKITCTISAEEI